MSINNSKCIAFSHLISTLGANGLIYIDQCTFCNCNLIYENLKILFQEVKSLMPFTSYKIISS